MKTTVFPGYEIDREVGRGGMATVYLARDVRHNRRVALKVLNPELSAAVGAERFLSEIRVTANLQHPNLLPLFDSGDVDGVLFYVMPFVDGETLRQRLDREGQLPVDEAVRIASTIAMALDYAHRNEIVHRDLKPENILLQDGQPLIADFGIALAISNAGGARVTQTGMSVGTPQYMSPEQAVGERRIDRRSDIYSLGALTYEMIAGEPPHTGASAQAIIARLMTDVPRPLTSERPTVPPHVERAVHRALNKLPADRFASAREFADALENRNVSGDVISAEPHSTAARSATWRTAMPWVIAAAGVGFGLFAWRRTTVDDGPRVIRFPIGVADRERAVGGPGVSFAISPDDRYIVYAGQNAGAPALMLRALDKAQGIPLTATSVQPSPAFSPDGKFVAVATDAGLMRVPVDGSAPRRIVTLKESPAGIVWMPNDTILASIGGRLVAFSAQGGAMRVVSTPDTARGEYAQFGPRLTDDGKYVLYISVGRDGTANNRVGIVPMAGGRPTLGAYRGVTVLGSRYGQAIWLMSTGLVVAAPVSALLTGASTEPITVMDGVLVGGGGAGKIAMSDRGSIVYSAGEAAAQLAFVSPSGTPTPIGTERRPFSTPRLSPDGTRIAVMVRGSRVNEVWLYTLATNTLARLAADDNSEEPEWSPDGTRIVYRAIGAAGQSLRWIRADGSGVGGELVNARYQPFNGMLSPDGKWVVFRNGGNMSSIRKAMVAPTDQSAPPHALIDSPFSELSVRLSPDGRSVAYLSSEGGGLDVYVTPFPGPGPRVRVSPDGAREAVWSRDGKTLYYWRGRTLVAASISTSPTLAVASLHDVLTGAYLSDPTTPNFDVTTERDRFLVLQGTTDIPPTIAVIGWDAELRAKLGMKR